MRGGQKMSGTHQIILEEGKLAFREFVKAREEPFAHNPAENRIAQKFQAFVIERESGVRFVSARAVRQRAYKQSAVPEFVAEGPLQLCQIYEQCLFLDHRLRAGFVARGDLLDLIVSVRGRS